MFDADCDNKIEATELEYVLRLVFKEKPDKRMVHDCMQRFDVDGKFTSSSIYLDSCLKRCPTNEW